MDTKDEVYPNNTMESETSLRTDIGFPGIDDGDVHNDLVDIITSNYNSCSTDIQDIEDELKRILKDPSLTKTTTDGYKWDYDDFTELVDSFDFDNYADYSGISDSSSFYDIIIDISDFSTDLKTEIVNFGYMVFGLSDTLSVSEIQDKMNDYYSLNVENLDTSDQKLFGSMVDVAISSTDYWLPVSSGGQDGFDDLENYFSNCLISGPNASSRVGGDWWKIILADAAGVVEGAAAAVVTHPATAAPNPALGGVPTAGVVGVIVGAGQSVTMAIGTANP